MNTFGVFPLSYCYSDNVESYFHYSSLNILNINIKSKHLMLLTAQNKPQKVATSSTQEPMSW